MRRAGGEREDQGTLPAAEERLESWKEIANYLKKSIRTVQRWERDEQLPVYRRKADKGQKQLGQVFAYPSELDAWWKAVRAGQRPAERWWAVWRRAGWVYAAAGAISVVLLGGISLWRMQHASAVLEEQLVAAWRFKFGEFSPDGEWFAYRDEDNGHLWLRNLSDLKPQLLVGERVHERIAWSRDSAGIAFVSLGAVPYRTEILNIGSRVRRALREEADGNVPPIPFDFTPDGKALLCQSISGRRQLLFLPLEEGQDVRTGSLDWSGRGRARISPNGRFIAYEASTDRGSGIFVRPLNESRPEVRVTGHSARESLPAWSTDGRLLYFTRFSRDIKLCFVEIDQSTGAAGREFEVRPLQEASRVVTPTVIPRGDVMVVRLARNPPEQVFLLEVDPATGRPKGPPATAFPEASTATAWSSDGARLFYQDFRAQFSDPANWRGKVYVERDLQSGVDRVVALQPPGATRENLYWSAVHAESQRVIWAPSNGSPFYWHDPATGETKQVEIDDLSIEADLAWSPDRSEVLFSARRRGSGTHDLAVLRLSDERVKILASSRWILHGAWSPDAAQIAFTEANCLKVVAARGGPAREIVCAGGADLPAPGKFRGERVDYLWDNAIHPSWSPDGRRLAWTVPVPEKKRVELWIVDAASGAREVAFAGENDYYSLPRRPLWSPSGRHIAFTMLWYLDREIWRLRGLARAAPRWQAAQIGRASP